MPDTNGVETPEETTDAEQERETRTCFVIARIGGDTSAERRTTDGLIDLVLTPVLEDELKLEVTVAHRIDRSGSITDQVIQSVVNADLVVADVTGLNPNVMYELAIRHCKRRPVLMLCNRAVTPTLPFDIATDRAVFYTEDFRGAIDLREEVLAKAKAAIDDEAPDNPVVRAMKDEVFDAAVKQSGEPLLQQIAEKLDLLAIKTAGPAIGSLAARSGRIWGGAQFTQQFFNNMHDDGYAELVIPAGLENFVHAQLKENGVAYISEMELLEEGQVRVRIEAKPDAHPATLKVLAERLQRLSMG